MSGASDRKNADVSRRALVLVEVGLVEVLEGEMSDEV